MTKVSVSLGRAGAVLAAACVLWLTGCGEQRTTVLMPVAPVPVEMTFDQVAAKARAGESDWAIIWAVRQSRRAWPLTAGDIDRLREAEVGERVIDFMLETVTAMRLHGAVAMTVEEVLGLKAAGISDDDVIREITQTGTIFHLKMADVEKLRAGGVSDAVINFMLYTRQLERGPETIYIVPDMY
jgi:hypothetical protein